MPIIQTEKIKIKWNSSNYAYYTKKGYTYTHIGDEFEIDYHDLPVRSGIKVLCQCDFCPNTFFREYKKVVNQKIIVCLDHKYEKFKITFKEKYGVENPFELQSVKDKIEKTSLERYGTKNPAQSEIVKQRIKETNLRIFGVEWAVASPSVRQKSKETMLKRYGVDCALKSPIIREKIKETLLRDYGVEYITQSKIIKQKIAKSYRKYDSATAMSRQQEFLYEVFGGEPNYPIEEKRLIPGRRKRVDIAFPKSSIYIECDFRGHFVWGRRKLITDANVFHNDRLYDKEFIEKGWKVIHFVSRKDNDLPSSFDLLMIKNYCFIALTFFEMTRIIIDLDQKFILFESNWKIIPLDNLL